MTQRISHLTDLSTFVQCSKIVRTTEKKGEKKLVSKHFQ